MLPSGTPDPIAEKKISVGVYEGGGYSAKGIYRPAYDCRMKTNEYRVLSGLSTCHPSND